MPSVKELEISESRSDEGPRPGMSRPSPIQIPRTQESSESEKDADLKPIQADDFKPESRQESSESESDADTSDSATGETDDSEKRPRPVQRKRTPIRKNPRNAGEARRERRKKASPRQYS